MQKYGVEPSLGEKEKEAGSLVAVVGYHFIILYTKYIIGLEKFSN